MSVIIFHGTDDEHVLYEGGKPKQTVDRHERVDKSVAYAVNFWVKHDGCDKKADRVENEIYVKETDSHGKDGTSVEVYAVKGGGHSWFGHYKGRPWEGKEIKGISCTDLMWNFFKQHPKK